MIAQHDDCWDSEAEQNVNQRLHFVRLSVISQITRKNKNVRHVSDSLELVFQFQVTLRIKMQVGCGCDSHMRVN